MRVIGLTGGIACGKSMISSYLQSMGVPIIDGDVISHELTAEHGEALPLIRQNFGDEVFLSDGQLHRKALGKLVFSSAEALAILDSIMQPLIRCKIDALLDDLRAKGEQICVLDMPLLYEKKLDQLCDSTWCVWVSVDEQLRRLMERDMLTAEEAKLRIESQIPCDEKAAKSNVVIDSSGTVEETREQVRKQWDIETAAALRG